MSTNPLPTLAECEAILRMDFLTFLERSFDELNPQGNLICGQYVDLLASALQKCVKGHSRRLIINLPPRTLKSHAASVALPAWLLGRDPSKEIICASYGQDLSDKLARDCRTLMTSAFYRRVFPRTVLSPFKNSVNDFMTTAQGGRMSTSVNGVLTGRGADIIILDDILKPDDALSETRRRAANDWYFNTLMSRLNSKEKGIIIMVMQRLHQEDLVGEVTEREHWDVLSLPAIAQQDERYLIESLFGNSFFVRKAGDALHPERDSLATTRSSKRRSGSTTFKANTSRARYPAKVVWSNLTGFNTTTPGRSPYVSRISCKAGIRRTRMATLTTTASAQPGGSTTATSIYSMSIASGLTIPRSNGSWRSDGGNSNLPNC